MYTIKGGTAPHLDASMRSTFSVEIGSHSPNTGTMQVSNESCGNTDSSSRAILILEIPNVYIPRHAGEVCRVFGFADEMIMTGDRLRQENFRRRGLFINYQYLPNLKGVANLIVAISRDETRASYLRILDRLSKKPLTDIQGVFA